jgi:hypothetical protein
LQLVVGAKASGLYRCPSDTGPPDPINVFAVPTDDANGKASYSINYVFSHGVNDAICSDGLQIPGTQAVAKRVPIPSTERGAFGVNIWTKLRDITDGTSNTFAMGEAAQGNFTNTPKWTVCDGRFCTAADLLSTGAGQPWLTLGPLSATSTTGVIPAMNIACNVIPSGDLIDGGLDPQLVKLRTASLMACTMEPLNKNPVTASYFAASGFAGGPGVTAFSCQSTWTLTGIPPQSPGGAKNQAVLSYGGAYGSMSNFRSDHPSGALFLMCDGSVHFIGENIDMGTYTALSTIQGGESVQGALVE